MDRREFSKLGLTAGAGFLLTGLPRADAGDARDEIPAYLRGAGQEAARPAVRRRRRRGRHGGRRRGHRRGPPGREDRPDRGQRLSRRHRHRGRHRAAQFLSTSGRPSPASRSDRSCAASPRRSSTARRRSAAPPATPRCIEGYDYDSVCTAIDTELYKLVAFEMLVEAGVAGLRQHAARRRDHGRLADPTARSSKAAPGGRRSSRGRSSTAPATATWPPMPGATTPSRTTTPSATASASATWHGQPTTLPRGPRRRGAAARGMRSGRPDQIVRARRRAARRAGR